jgi:hypothetical protein
MPPGQGLCFACPVIASLYRVWRDDEIIPRRLLSALTVAGSAGRFFGENAIQPQRLLWQACARLTLAGCNAMTSERRR